MNCINCSLRLTEYNDYCMICNSCKSIFNKESLAQMQPKQSEPMMNELEFSTLCEMKRMVKECSHIDLIIRVGGENRMLEADFLKDLILALPLLSPSNTR